MVEHVVLLKVKEGTPQAKIDAMVEGVRGLKAKIEGIVEISIGKNYTDRGQGFDYALVVRMESKETLERYLPHPDHQEVVVNRIKPIIDDILAVDYEF